MNYVTNFQDDNENNRMVSILQITFIIDLIYRKFLNDNWKNLNWTSMKTLLKSFFFCFSRKRRRKLYPQHLSKRSVKVEDFI